MIIIATLMIQVPYDKTSKIPGKARVQTFHCIERNRLVMVISLICHICHQYHRHHHYHHYWNHHQYHHTFLNHWVKTLAKRFPMWHFSLPCWPHNAMCRWWLFQQNDNNQKWSDQNNNHQKWFDQNNNHQKWCNQNNNHQKWCDQNNQNNIVIKNGASRII